jgi:hypothetical protein
MRDVQTNPEVRQNERTSNTERMRDVRTNPEVRQNEQTNDTGMKKAHITKPRQNSHYSTMGKCFVSGSRIASPHHTVWKKLTSQPVMIVGIKDASPHHTVVIAHITKPRQNTHSLPGSVGASPHHTLCNKTTSQNP